MRRFLTASDYCFGYFDSGDEGTYNPTREYFHVGLGVPRADEEDEGAGNRSPPRQGVDAATPPRIVPPAARSRSLAPAQPQRPDLEQLRELQAKVELDRLLLQ